MNPANVVTRQEVLAKAREAAHPHDCLDTLAGQSAQTLLFLQVPNPSPNPKPNPNQALLGCALSS